MAEDRGRTPQVALGLLKNIVMVDDATIVELWKRFRATLAWKSQPAASAALASGGASNLLI